MVYEQTLAGTKSRVVSPGLESLQTQLAKPEQSVLYPSCEPVWLYGTWSLTHYIPFAIASSLLTQPWLATKKTKSMTNDFILKWYNKFILKLR